MIAIVQRSAAASAREISRLAWRHGRTEWGGPAWGRLHRTSDGRDAVWIAAMTPGQGAASAVDFEMDPESYVIGLRMLREAGFPADIVEVGLWHSHPGYGAFLSHVDEDYFRLLYPQPWKVSVVVDQVNDDFAVFVKKGRAIGWATIYPYSGNKLGKVPRLNVHRAWMQPRRRSR